jgi:hypothetical protein
MRRVCYFLSCLILMGKWAVGQGVPRAELFTGYSYFHENLNFFNRGAPINSVRLNGWNASLALNLNSWLAVKGDVAGHYGNASFTGLGRPGKVGVNLHSALFGPQLMIRESEGTVLFAHALIGMFRSDGDPTVGIRTSPSSSDFLSPETFFAMGFGGGLDLKRRGKVCLRLLQVDWLVRRDFLGYGSGIRASTGLIFRFGQ